LLLLLLLLLLLSLLAMVYKLWTREDDARLWESRSTKSTAVLACEFDRSPGGIRSRLKHLQNPEHKAYQRLFGTTSTSTSAGAAAACAYDYACDASASSSGTIMLSTTNYYEEEAPPQVSATQQDFDSVLAQHGAYQSCVGATTTPKGLLPAPSNSFAGNSVSVRTAQGSSVQNSSNVTLNPEQQRTLQLSLTGRNMFLTGAAGVGKSFLLRHMVSILQSRCANGGDSVAVTASTGIAASHIAGVTLHSWAGIGIASGKDPAKLIQKVRNNRGASHRWRTTKTLVIDEISMIDGVLFEALDAIGKAVRGNSRQPFGGLQLILSGDFYQLPPVSLRYAGFVFSSNAWKNGNIIVAELTTVVRQEGDLKFVRILRELREGKCSSEVENILATCHVSRKKRSTDGIVPTKLYCTNKTVDSENNARLEGLPGMGQSFEAKDRFKGNYTRRVQTSLRQATDRKAPSVIRLKTGAQVMLLKNSPGWNLVNGSRGVVIGFDSNDERGKNTSYPIVRFTGGAIHTIEPFVVFQATTGGAMTREQLPIKLAWCLTVHKSQGMTLDRLELQLDDAFDYGQAYVALSRVQSLAGLWIKGKSVTQQMVKAHPDVIEFHRRHQHNF